MRRFDIVTILFSGAIAAFVFAMLIEGGIVSGLITLGLLLSISGFAAIIRRI